MWEALGPGMTRVRRPRIQGLPVLIVNLEVVLLPAAVRDKTHKRQQAVLGKYEANIKQNARKSSQSKKKMDGGCLPLIHLLT